MHRRVSRTLLSLVVVAEFSALACVRVSGFCAAAFADAPAGTGAIGGGFFINAPTVPRGGLPPGGAPLGAAPGPVQANSGLDLCGPAVAGASAAHNLPAGLLNAIATVESGRPNPTTGAVKPWPWTIDANGTGYMYPTALAAEQAAAGFEAAGIASLEIGCLQVNLAQHPDAFHNLAQAFDPAANANYAATFLTGLEQKFGNWPQAVAAYHSQTPALGGPYQARVYAQWQGANPAVEAASSMPAHGQMMAGSLPVPAALPAATSFQMSSLFAPARMMMRPQNGATGRSLASYRASPVAIASSLAPQG